MRLKCVCLKAEHSRKTVVGFIFVTLAGVCIFFYLRAVPRFSNNPAPRQALCMDNHK